MAVKILDRFPLALELAGILVRVGIVLEGDPDRVRGKGLRRRRAKLINPGLDHLRHIDRHDKLKAWDIQIYTAIDAYSRKIVWILR